MSEQTAGEREVKAFIAGWFAHARNPERLVVEDAWHVYREGGTRGPSMVGLSEKASLPDPREDTTKPDVATLFASPATSDAGDASEALARELLARWTAATGGVRRGDSEAALQVADWLASREAAAATRARAEALRELAGMTRQMPADPDKAAAWLRARADSIDAPARTKPTTASLLADLAATREADQGAREKRALGGAS